MTTRQRAQSVALAFGLGLGASGLHVAAQQLSQQAPAPQLVVTSAAPDPGGQTLTITGANFGARPFVTLDLVPVTIRFAIDTQIVAAVPVNDMPAGTYLLTVSRGTSAADSGSLQLALGAVEPTRDGTTKSGPPGSPDSHEATLSPSAAEPAAKVGDRVITVAEVDREWQRTDPAGYLALSRQIYDGRRRAADLMVTNELLAREAKARGLTPEALLKEEIPKRTVTMPDSAVTSLYQGLGDRTRGASLEQMRPALRAWLERMTEPELAKMNYVEELMKVSTRAEVFLAAPRVQVDGAAEDPTLGPATAPVEIVAFGDFQSVEYARFAQAFGKMRDTFGDRIRLVFKHLPALGPESVTVAEAAACAHAQGKFWAYHDAVLAQPGSLDAARLKQVSSDVGLNRPAFDACLDRGEFGRAIRHALDEAERYAIVSSPSFLVNGRLAPTPPSFLPPFEFFKRIIEEELLRQARGASPAGR
jgi:protein-disulfide isomerase